MFDGLGEAIEGLIVAATFLSMLALAGVIAAAASWLGYPSSAPWIVGGGVVAGWIAVKVLRATVLR